MIRYLLGFSLSLGALAAGQGIVMKQSSEDLQSQSKIATVSYVEPERVATSSTVDGRGMGFVYLAKGNTMRMIDHSKKTVREISGADLEKMMGQVNEAMTKMQEQMKNLPPQQREMMEKMMGDRMKEMMGGAQSASPVYKRGDGSGEIGGRPCDWYEGYQGDELFSKVCAADWSGLDVRASDFAVFEKMAGFLTKLAPSVASFTVVGGDDWERQQLFPGIPLEQTIYSGGKPRTRTILESLERSAIDEEVFQAPRGYKVEKGLPDMR